MMYKVLAKRCREVEIIGIARSSAWLCENYVSAQLKAVRERMLACQTHVQFAKDDPFFQRFGMYRILNALITDIIERMTALGQSTEVLDGDKTALVERSCIFLERLNEETDIITVQMIQMRRVVYPDCEIVLRPRLSPSPGADVRLRSGRAPVLDMAHRVIEEGMGEEVSVQSLFYE